MAQAYCGRLFKAITEIPNQYFRGQDTVHVSITGVDFTALNLMLQGQREKLLARLLTEIDVHLEHKLLADQGDLFERTGLYSCAGPF